MRDVGPTDFFIVDRGDLPLEVDELLLGRDVLDTQIVDVVGHRMARVSDGLLTRLLYGRLEVAAVDVGVGALLRGLGMRWLSELLTEQAVDWGDLHLTCDRGHAIQLATTVAAVPRLDASALAELLTRLDPVRHRAQRGVPYDRPVKIPAGLRRDAQRWHRGLAAALSRHRELATGLWKRRLGAISSPISPSLGGFGLS